MSRLVSRKNAESGASRCTPMRATGIDCGMMTMEGRVAAGQGQIWNEQGSRSQAVAVRDWMPSSHGAEILLTAQHMWPKAMSWARTTGLHRYQLWARQQSGELFFDDCVAFTGQPLQPFAVQYRDVAAPATHQTQFL